MVYICAEFYFMTNVNIYTIIGVIETLTLCPLLHSDLDINNQLILLIWLVWTNNL